MICKNSNTIRHQISFLYLPKSIMCGNPRTFRYAHNIGIHVEQYAADIALLKTPCLLSTTSFHFLLPSSKAYLSLFFYIGKTPARPAWTLYDCYCVCAFVLDCATIRYPWRRRDEFQAVTVCNSFLHESVEEWIGADSQHNKVDLMNLSVTMSHAIRPLYSTLIYQPCFPVSPGKRAQELWMKIFCPYTWGESLCCWVSTVVCCRCRAQEAGNH